MALNSWRKVPPGRRDLLDIERFPGDFMFQLNAAEVEILKSQNVISSLEAGEEPAARPPTRSPNKA